LSAAGKATLAQARQVIVPSRRGNSAIVRVRSGAMLTIRQDTLPTHQRQIPRDALVEAIASVSGSLSTLADDAGLCRIAFLLNEVREETELEKEISAPSGR
jgi:hypothetical protein